MNTGYVLAFDFGLRHIGVAVGQTITGTANPLKTLKARNGTTRLGRDRQIDSSVAAGLSAGRTAPQHGRQRERDVGPGPTIRSRAGTPKRRKVQMVDERLTSYASRKADPETVTWNRRGTDRRDLAGGAWSGQLNRHRQHDGNAYAVQAARAARDQRR